MSIRTIAGMAATFALAAAATGAHAAGINWTASWTAAQASMKQSHKLAMVDMYTDWCGWCKKLDADVYPDAAVVKAAAQFVPVKLNAEKEGKDLAAKFSVDGYPTILFVDSSGTLVDKIVGYEPAPQFAKDLNRIAEDSKSFPALEARVKAHPEDTASALKLAGALLRRGRTADATTLLASIEKQNPKAPGLGALYLQIAQGDMNPQHVADAVTWYKKVVASSTDKDELVQAHLGLYSAYAHQNKLPEAKAELDAVLATPGISTDEMVQAHAGLYSLYRAQNKLPEAKAELQAILAIPGIPDNLKQNVQAALTQMNNPVPTPAPRK